MKPFYDRNGITIFHGDSRKILPKLGLVDCVVADPPYGDTSLDWDVPISGWLPHVKLKEGGSVWCFGSLRMFMKNSGEFKDWTVAQDIVWEKQNGGSL
jgi:site-specific DNA-methyltransferase (adenine-specific)